MFCSQWENKTVFLSALSLVFKKHRTQVVLGVSLDSLITGPAVVSMRDDCKEYLSSILT